MFWNYGTFGKYIWKYEVRVQRQMTLQGLIKSFKSWKRCASSLLAKWKMTVLKGLLKKPSRILIVIHGFKKYIKYLS